MSRFLDDKDSHRKHFIRFHLSGLTLKHNFKQDLLSLNTSFLNPIEEIHTDQNDLKSKDRENKNDEA
jgi:hypothetical protein